MYSSIRNEPRVAWHVTRLRLTRNGLPIPVIYRDQEAGAGRAAQAPASVRIHKRNTVKETSKYKKITRVYIYPCTYVHL